MRTFTLNFYLRPSKRRKDGTAPIYVRITVNKKRAEIAIKRYIRPEEWDEKRGKASGKKGPSRELNAYIDSIRNKIYQHHRDMMDKDEEISAQALKDRLLGVKHHKGKTLVEVFEYHNQRMRELVGTEYAAGTLQRFVTTLKHLKEFMALTYQIDDIYLVDLKFSFISDFDHHLRSVRHISNNTCVKYMALFRKIILMSIENEWMSHNPFRQYKGKIRIVDREFLDQEELQTLHDKVLHTERLEVVRDLFLFSCYTGLAYADISKLTPDNISLGVDGERWINVNRTKTDTKSLIPILPPALDIIRIYQNTPEVQIKGTLLPVRSNQKMNAYLKEIADLCGIKKHLTFHMARHTFATTVTLSNGVPIESVSSMLGHRNIRTTQHYAKIVQRKVGEDMKALKGKLFGEKNGGLTDTPIKKLS